VIIEIIKQNNEVTIPEMATKIGVTQRSVERNIEKDRESTRKILKTFGTISE
jgi:predicted DNA-binding transcriptional regulator YafY